MNDKTTLQELIDLLVQRHQMETTDAEAFVKTVLSLIEEALERDKYVKIKGLGTFKLIEIEERESVDVNTGERIRIQSHSRISFLPDPSLRELVNKPFAHFETVVLNENTHFDDWDEMSAAEKEEQEENEHEGIVVEPEPQLEMVVEPEVKEEIVKTEITEEVVEKENAVESSPMEVVEESVPAAPEPEAENVLPDLNPKKTARLPWCMIASVLLAGVILGGGIIWGLLSGRRYIPEDFLSALMEEKNVVLVADSLEADSLIPPMHPLTKTTKEVVSEPEVVEVQDTLQVPVEKKNVSAAKKVSSEVVPVPTSSKKTPKKKPESLSDTVDYSISGTKFAYTIQEGETLVRVALKFYGNKKLWPYLVKHNASVIKDPNNVPAGLIINIPVLTPKK